MHPERSGLPSLPGTPGGLLEPPPLQALQRRHGRSLRREEDLLLHGRWSFPDPEFLVNIDIDCHHSGTLEGALGFARHLRDRYLPNLYYEASTNGNGVHGYIVVVKGDLGDEGLNTVLGRLDHWLKNELSRGDWDVELVEVKGQAPEFTWGRDKYEFKTYQSGQLAKLPREALDRADELRQTSRVTVDQLRRLRLPSDDLESVDSVRRKPDGSQTPGPFLAVRKPKPARNGSISGHHFSDDELSRLKGGYLSVARDLLGETKLVATGRKVVTDEDFAIFLMLLRFFTDNMNADGTLPTARWREMWRALSEAGDIERSWCHHRYAAMRNFLSGKDLLSWEESGYVVGGEIHGTYLPGKAAKWRAGEDLMRRLGEPESVVGEKGRGESILYGCQDSRQSLVEANSIEFIMPFFEDQHQEQEEEGGESILYGCNLSFAPLLSETTGRSTPEPPFLARLRAEYCLQRPQFMGYSWQQTGWRMAA